MYTSKARLARPKSAAPDLAPVRFAIVGNPRTGSSYLASLLDSHPDIACWNYEIFDADEAFDASSCDLPEHFLTEHVLPVKATAVGFKLLWDALDRRKAIWEALRSLEFVLLHVYRENLLDSFISFRLATLNQAFTYSDGEYSIASFEGDFDQCLEWFELCEARDAQIRARARDDGLPSLEIEYADLYASRELVLRFLQVGPAPLSSNFRRQRQGAQSDAIINYSELRARFLHTRWACFFEDA